MAVQSTLEDILYNIKTYVEGNYSTYLDAMETLKADSVVLEDVKDHYIGSIPQNANRHPYVGYFPMEINIDPLDLGNDEIRMEVMLAFVLKGSASDNLVKKALRYTECFRALVDEDRTLGAACEDARVSKVNYFAAEPGGENLMEIQVILTVTHSVTI